MKKVKSFTNIWSVEKVLYSINDFKLPFPVTFSQMAWFVATEFLVIMLADIPPISMIQNVLIKYICLPAGVTWFMSQKAFDGKKPYRFLKSVFSYYLQPRVTYAGKVVKLKKEAVDQAITYVRSDILSVSD